jgi:hypothetical protein
MPVILPAKHHAAWLGETEDGSLKGLIVPYDSGSLKSTLTEFSRVWAYNPEEPPHCGSASFYKHGLALSTSVGAARASDGK